MIFVPTENEISIYFASRLSIKAARDFLLVQGVSEDKTTEILNQIFEHIERLKKFPFLGQKETILSASPKEYRRLIFGYYRIVYFVREDTVYIASIFDSRQDPNKLKV